MHMCVLPASMELGALDTHSFTQMLVYLHEIMIHLFASLIIMESLWLEPFMSHDGMYATVDWNYVDFQLCNVIMQEEEPRGLHDRWSHLIKVHYILRVNLLNLKLIHVLL